MPSCGGIEHCSQLINTSKCEKKTTKEVEDKRTLAVKTTLETNGSKSANSNSGIVFYDHLLLG